MHKILNCKVVRGFMEHELKKYQEIFQIGTYMVGTISPQRYHLSNDFICSFIIGIKLNLLYHYLYHPLL